MEGERREDVGVWEVGEVESWTPGLIRETL